MKLSTDSSSSSSVFHAENDAFQSAIAALTAHGCQPTPSGAAVPASLYPPELCAIPQWVAWKLGDTNPETGRRRKIPLNLNAQPGQKNFASTANPEERVAFEVAAAAAERGKFGAKGIGFVFTNDDPYCFIDLDNCLSPNGSLTPEAAAVHELMAGTYGEVSQSGSGLHYICIAKIPGKVATGTIDIYPHGQYCAMTGNTYGGLNPVIDKQAEVEKLAALLRRGGSAALVNPPPVYAVQTATALWRLAIANC